MRNLKRDDRKGGKVSKPWLGPYTCQNLYKNNCCQLQSNDGTLLKKMYNLKHIRKFYEKKEEIMIEKSEKNVYKIMPITKERRKEISSQLTLTYVSAPQISSITSDKPPQMSTEICGDGNCFFRAVSFILTGTEDNYGQLRNLTASHLKNMDFTERKIFLDDDPKEYLEKSRMMGY